MSSVEVTAAVAGDGWDCTVTLRDGSDTRHRVRMSRADLARLAPGASDPVDLVKASFAFLLECEPKESILRDFDLTVIGRYSACGAGSGDDWLGRPASIGHDGTSTGRPA